MCVFFCFSFYTSFLHSLSWLFLCGYFHSAASFSESPLCPGVQNTWSVLGFFGILVRLMELDILSRGVNYFTHCPEPST